MQLSSTHKAMLVGVSGTALQWYDFAIFGYFAPLIAANFFPNHNPISALLSTFGVFAVGYLLSPLGSILFGFIGDYYGRKRALTLSILAMAIPTCLISVLPSYHTIGMAAPILITLLRMTQGFVASAEYTGSAVFLVEHAPQNKKAFYGCLTSSAYSTGVILAGLVASLLTASFMPNWCWRLGFSLAFIAGIWIFYLRTHVSETPIYQHIKTQEKVKQPFLTAFKAAPFAVFGVIGLAALVGIMTYGTYVFAPTYLHQYCNLSMSTAALITTFALAVDALVEPCFALWADKVGHVRVVTLGLLLTLLLSFPLFYLLTSANLFLITLSMMCLSLLIALTFSPLNAYMVELFPKNCRYSGFGVSFHIGISIFGGTTPLILMWLVNVTGQLIAPAYYYLLGALIGIISLILCEYSRRMTNSTKLNREASNAPIYSL